MKHLNELIELLDGPGKVFLFTGKVGYDFAKTVIHYAQKKPIPLAEFDGTSGRTDNPSAITHVQHQASMLLERYKQGVVVVYDLHNSCAAYRAKLYKLCEEMTDKNIKFIISARKPEPLVPFQALSAALPAIIRWELI